MPYGAGLGISSAGDIRARDSSDTAVQHAGPAAGSGLLRLGSHADLRLGLGSSLSLTLAQMPKPPAAG